ncbi:hypothetical protein B0T18DRAFT_466802 [Schizothecium vesticola]|uniref:Uncharacterized protein n=1 Tax=Schizothecium vesticola TaxID=314040 RepID=A0AA40K5W9_9PEZI|nr:hypothetical protein B0T18DRAFT_466802 [Schizothecium vesticola]
MHSLTAITALLSVTVVAAGGLPPHSNPYYITHRPWTSTPSPSGRASSTSSLRQNPTNVKVADAGPTSMTMAIIKMAGIPVSATHGHNHNATLPTICMPPPAMMSPGAKHSYVLPLNFGDNLGVSKGKLLGDESLSEYSFELQDSETVNRATINVFYVTDFSLNTSIACKELLWNSPELCKDKNIGRSPIRPCFLPCEHKAYIYVEDHVAQANAKCLTGSSSGKSRTRTG